MFVDTTNRLKPAADGISYGLEQFGVAVLAFNHQRMSGIHTSKDLSGQHIGLLQVYLAGAAAFEEGFHYSYCHDVRELGNLLLYFLDQFYREVIGGNVLVVDYYYAPDNPAVVSFYYLRPLPPCLSLKGACRRLWGP